MQQRERFFTNAHGVDDKAVARIIQKAIELEIQLPDISRIVFVAHGLQNDGWLERQYGREGVKKIRKGASLPHSNVPANFESLKTYGSEQNEILITMGLDSDEILLLDDNYESSAVLAFPWTQGSIDKWTRITNAINIDDNTAAPSFASPPCVLIKALEELTEAINMSTGLMHSSDDDLAKTYLRTLAKHGVYLNETEIESYLIKELDWTKEHSKDFLEIVNKLNTGRSFKGGDQTGLKTHFDRWTDACA